MINLCNCKYAVEKLFVILTTKDLSPKTGGNVQRGLHSFWPGFFWTRKADMHQEPVFWCCQPHRLGNGRLSMDGVDGICCCFASLLRKLVTELTTTANQHCWWHLLKWRQNMYGLEESSRSTVNYLSDFLRQTRLHTVVNELCVPVLLNTLQWKYGFAHMIYFSTCIHHCQQMIYIVRHTIPRWESIITCAKVELIRFNYQDATRENFIALRNGEGTVSFWCDRLQWRFM